MSAVAFATLAATFVLILAGGLVTNTGAALAVPDWPTTFGYNMPVAHRLVASLILGAAVVMAVRAVVGATATTRRVRFVLRAATSEARR
jgi:heme A synthase